MMIEYQLSVKDRERFDLPEWVADGREALDDVPWPTLAAWEKELAPLKVVEILAEWEEKSATGVAAYLWLCLKVAGGNCPTWVDFDIRTTAVKQKASTPDPLVEASSPPSSETGESTAP